MPGLNIVILTEDAERYRGALMLAMSAAAMGSEARLFLQLDAVRLLKPGALAPQDTAHRKAGLPDLKALIGDALASEVQIMACQTGMSLAGLTVDDLDPRITTGGPMLFLGQIAPSDRLLTV